MRGILWASMMGLGVMLRLLAGGESESRRQEGMVLGSAGGESVVLLVMYIQQIKLGIPSRRHVYNLSCNFELLSRFFKECMNDFDA